MSVSQYMLDLALTNLLDITLHAGQSQAEQCERPQSRKSIGQSMEVRVGVKDGELGLN